MKLTSPVIVDIRIRPCLKHKTLYFCDRNMKEKEGNGKGKVITETVKELNFSGFFDCVYNDRSIFKILITVFDQLIIGLRKKW